jgi:hypothetical protein
VEGVSRAGEVVHGVAACGVVDQRRIRPARARLTSAPSGDQVRKILWSEIRRAHVRGGLPGHITDAAGAGVEDRRQVVAFGRKPQDFADRVRR